MSRKIGGDSAMAVACQSGHDVVNGVLAQVDGHHARAGERERLRHRAPDAPRCPGDQNAFSLETRPNAPASLDRSSRLGRSSPRFALLIGPRLTKGRLNCTVAWRNSHG